MSNTQTVGITEAADLINKSTKTLYRDIQKGKISVVTDTVTDKKQIQIAELIRVYGPIRTMENVLSNMSNNENKSLGENWFKTLEREKKIVLLETENAGMQRHIAGLEERLRDKERHANSTEEKMQTTIDILRGELANTKLLVDFTKKRPWWQFWK